MIIIFVLHIFNINKKFKKEWVEYNYIEYWSDNMPTISIVIPVYNVEEYLEESLNSVLNQTFDDFEVICVDDGSTDNSLEILNYFKSYCSKK